MIKGSKIRLLLCIVLMLPVLVNSVLAQGKEAINLESALKLAGAQNLTIQAITVHQEILKAEHIMAKEWWLPDLYTGLRANKLSGAVMNSDGKYQLDIDSDNLWAGLGIELNWNLADGIYKSKSARLNHEAAVANSISERNDILLEVVDTYYDFITSQLYFKSYEGLVSQADQIVRQMQLQVDAGVMYSSDLLMSRSNSSQLKVQMLNAKSDYIKYATKLIQLLALDPTTELIAVDTLLIPLKLDEVNETIDLESIYQARPEIRAATLRGEALRTEKARISKGLMLPDFRLQTEGAYFGGLTEEVVPVLSTEYPNPDQLYPTYGLHASLLWKIPLATIFSGGEIKKYRSEIKLNKLISADSQSRIAQEIYSAVEKLKIAEEQMEISSTGLQFAKQAIDQSIQRIKAGNVRPFEILQAQEMWIKSRLQYLKSIATYNKAQYELYVAKGNNL